MYMFHLVIQSSPVSICLAINSTMPSCLGPLPVPHTCTQHPICSPSAYPQLSTIPYDVYVHLHPATHKLRPLGTSAFARSSHKILKLQVYNHYTPSFAK